MECTVFYLKREPRPHGTDPRERRKAAEDGADQELLAEEVGQAGSDDCNDAADHCALRRRGTKRERERGGRGRGSQARM